MVAHSAPIHSLRCCPAAEHFFATKEREGEPSEQEGERGREREEGWGWWGKEGADLDSDWIRQCWSNLI